MALITISSADSLRRCSRICAFMAASSLRILQQLSCTSAEAEQRRIASSNVGMPPQSKIKDRPEVSLATTLARMAQTAFAIAGSSIHLRRHSRQYCTPSDSRNTAEYPESRVSSSSIARRTGRTATTAFVLLCCSTSFSACMGFSMLPASGGSDGDGEASSVSIPAEASTIHASSGHLVWSRETSCWRLSRGDTEGFLASLRERPPRPRYTLGTSVHVAMLPLARQVLFSARALRCGFDCLCADVRGALSCGTW
mmetsp:Transcript_59396/g.141671  ORF Transcript_59396/g.141671 Transcript_59396/m.141671 type:complete len:254 (+) Transcript_59396:763-1524(+)